MGLFDAIASNINGTLAGATSLITTNMTNNANKRIANSTNEANLQLAREQNDWNEAMWNKQNEYNLPSEQLKRLRAAGINPNILGSEISTGTSSNLPQSADLANQLPYQLQNPDLSNAFNVQLGTAAQLLQEKKINSEIKKTDKESAKLDAETNEINSLLQARYDQIVSNSKLTDQQRANAEQEFKNLVSKNKEIEASINNLNTSIKEVESRIALLSDQHKSNEIDLMYYEMQKRLDLEEQRARIVNILSQSGLTKEQTEVVKQEYNHLLVQIEKSIHEKNIAEIESSIRYFVSKCAESMAQSSSREAAARASSAEFNAEHPWITTILGASQQASSFVGHLIGSAIVAK